MLPLSFAFANPLDVSLDLLTAAEHSEFRTLLGASRQRDWLAGRTAAKRAVGRAAGVDPQRITLLARPGAAPVPMLMRGQGAPQRLALRVSIAHRGGWAIAAAFAPGLCVGVDLERANDVVAEHARYFVAPEERDTAARLGAGRLWALKEAAWKALGLRQELPFRELALPLSPDGRVTGALVRGVWFGGLTATWTLPQGFVAAAFSLTPDAR